jgi:hypothetical protein
MAATFQSTPAWHGSTHRCASLLPPFHVTSDETMTGEHGKTIGYLSRVTHSSP